MAQLQENDCKVKIEVDLADANSKIEARKKKVAEERLQSFPIVSGMATVAPHVARFTKDDARLLKSLYAKLILRKP